MLTFLGTEKYAVMVLMLGMAVLGFALILSWAIRSFWTKEDVIVLAVLATILIGLGLLVVFQPGWSVTPLHGRIREICPIPPIQKWKRNSHPY